MTFYFVRNPNAKDKPLFTDPDEVWWDSECAWTVIGKEYVQKFSGGYWRYLLLGAGPALRWHEGQLGWIRRVADPVWEDRYANGYCVRLDQRS